MTIMKTCEYTNDGERITAPGKFEGEPVFAPYFWALAMQGFADEDDGKTFTFRFNFKGQDASAAMDRELLKVFPTLRQYLCRKRTLKMWEDNQGFVHCA